MRVGTLLIALGVTIACTLPLRAQTVVTVRNTALTGRGASARTRALLPANVPLDLLDPRPEHGRLYVSTPRETHGWVPESSVRPVTAPPSANPTACALEGDAHDPQVRALNRLKNRTTSPGPHDIDANASLPRILQPGNDTHRWNTLRAAQVVGYVVSVHPGGRETANCHAASVAGRDTHIDIALQPQDEVQDIRHVVVEITPRMRAIHPDWTTPNLQQFILHHWIRIQGWLLLDAEHIREAENTNPGGASNWRATVWEIHPITNIEVLPGPPAQP
jgi:hypothetical protein